MEHFTISPLADAPAGFRIFRLDGPFALPSIWDFQSRVRGGAPENTILDVAGVPYMDSAALGSIMGVYVSCQRQHKKLGMVGVNDRLSTLFQVSGVDGILSSYPTIEQAIQAMKQ